MINKILEIVKNKPTVEVLDALYEVKETVLKNSTVNADIKYKPIIERVKSS